MKRKISIKMYIKNKYLLFGILFILVHTVMAISDSNPSNNIMSVSVNVIETKNISIYYIPIDNITQTEFDRAIINLTKFINNTYPTADDGLITGKSKTSINVNQGILDSDDRQAVLIDIQEKAIQAGFKYGIGIVRENWINDRTDIAFNTTGFTRSRVAFSAIVESGQIKTVAHEIGHKKPFNLCEEYYNTAWTEQDNDGSLCPNAVDTISGRFLNLTCLDNNGCPSNTFPLLYNFENIDKTTELRLILEVMSYEKK